MECNHKIQLKTGIIVPCGKCPACLANKRQELIFRLKEEYKASRFAIFVTLTYDNEHLPPYGVNKRDIQLFNKRLRKHFPPESCRFFVVSEYGDHTQRAHYHGLYFFTQDFDKKQIYDIFEASWQNGFISFGDVQEGSIVYCTKYCLKGSPTPPGQNDTFRLMSKMNGGLGISYLDKMSEFHKNNLDINFVYADGKKCRMPKYFKDKLISNKNNPLFIRLQRELEERISNEVRENTADEFKKFLSNRSFESYSQAVSAFNEFRCSKIENSEKLVKKHCKKQKF